MYKVNCASCNKEIEVEKQPVGAQIWCNECIGKPILTSLYIIAILERTINSMEYSLEKIEGKYPHATRALKNAIVEVEKDNCVLW